MSRFGSPARTPRREKSFAHDPPYCLAKELDGTKGVKLYSDSELGVWLVGELRNVEASDFGRLR